MTTGGFRGGDEVGVDVSALEFDLVDMVDAFKLFDRAELTRDGRSVADDRGVLRGVAKGVNAGAASSSFEGQRKVDLDECVEQ